MYYYLAASLPMLLYETEKTMPADEFVGICAQHLSDRDYRLLCTASISDLKPKVPSNCTLDRWRRWETSLRNELVTLRAKNRKVEVDRYLLESPVISTTQAIAREAFDQESPLQAEELLNRARWATLDELEVGHYFDIERILVYYLRLQVLQRKAMLLEEKGLQAFERIYAAMTETIYG